MGTADMSTQVLDHRRFTPPGDLDALKFGQEFDWDADSPCRSCRCEERQHKGEVEMKPVRDGEDLQRVLIHVPFPLTRANISSGFRPNAGPNFISEIGMRLAARLDSMRGTEGFEFSEYHITFCFARMANREGVIQTFESALRHVGCPDFYLCEAVKLPAGFRENP